MQHRRPKSAGRVYFHCSKSLASCAHSECMYGVAPPKHKLLDLLSNVQVLPPPLPPHLLPSRGWGKNASCREAASVALNSLLYRWKRIVYDISLNTEGILQPLGTRRMEPDSPKGAGREGEVQSHPFVTTVCPLLSSDDWKDRRKMIHYRILKAFFSAFTIISYLINGILELENISKRNWIQT